MVAIAPMLFASCATIASGGDPSITIYGNVSEPVTITTEKQTYADVTLPAITITSENNNFNDIVLKKKVNEWAFGNILIGGLIGWGIDLGTNSVSKPAQTEFSVVPQPKSK